GEKTGFDYCYDIVTKKAIIRNIYKKIEKLKNYPFIINKIMYLKYLKISERYK
ncbi:hypothetical protein H263_13518, partial [Brachyspira hampsonii 30599]